MKREDLYSSFIRLKCCVIIPTYNNCKTLNQVIIGVLNYTENIIVVNDGSTDNTNEILKKYNKFEIINIPQNKGKGNALKIGFAKALEKGYQYAITIDSDGQHKPEELEVFLNRIDCEPDSLIVGIRNLNQENMPENSSMANRLSNFWFHFYTGLNLQDTQTGYRLYPLYLIKNIKLFSGKYEFELELLIKAAWKNIRIISVKINAYYPPPEERVSHFRPYKDFIRISLLYTLFFFISVFWVKPLKFIKNINKNNIKEFFKNNILASKESNVKIVFSVMLGVFMGIIPIWGYQLISAIALAYILRLNKAIVIISANISIAPLLPIILYLSYLTGGVLMGSESVKSINFSSISFEFIKNNIIQYILGSVVLAVLLSLFFGLIVFLLLYLFRKSERK